MPCSFPSLHIIVLPYVSYQTHLITLSLPIPSPTLHDQHLLTFFYDNPTFIYIIW